MKKGIAFFLFFSLTSLFLFGQAEENRTKNFNLKRNLALEGYDAISYFDHHPQPGKEEISLTHRGVVYRFVSQSNRSKFMINPEKYEPAYGGWCAYAMGASGDKVKVDLDTYKIVDGKLYLFYNFWGNNTLTEWNRNEGLLKAKGDENWRKFIP